MEVCEFTEWRWNFSLGSFGESRFPALTLVRVLDRSTRAACNSGCDLLGRELRVRLDRGGVYGAEAVDLGLGVEAGELCCVSGVRGGVAAVDCVLADAVVVASVDISDK